MRAVAYIRVSTNKEEQELSLENQHEFFTKYITSRGDELVKIYSDKGKSATKMKNRKELNAMLRAAAQKKFEKLYVKDISRLFRNTLDFITVSRQLKDLGIELHLLNMGEGKDIDIFTLNLMAMVSENESIKISERVKFGKKFSKERGIVPNFVFGYERVDKFTLVPDPEESKWVHKIFDLYTEEEWGQARIAKYLFENRVKTKKKKDGQPNYNWSQNTVSNILTNRIYTGIVINGKESTKNIYSNERIKNEEEDWYIAERPEFRIISDEQFEKAQQIMKKNSERFITTKEKGGKTGPRRSDKHLLSNLIKCDCCGFSYRRYKRSYSENTAPKAWWTCSKRAAYGSGRCEAEYTRVDEEWLINCLNLMLNGLIQDKQSFFSLVESKCNAIIQDYIQKTVGIDIEAIQEELNELNIERERLKTLAVKGLITMEEAEHDMVPKNKRIEQLSFALNQTDKTRELTAKVKHSVKTFFATFEHFQLTEQIENSDLKKIIKEIRVKSKGEIYVYFNVDDDLEGLNFPINISGLFPYNSNPPKSKKNSKKLEETTEIQDIRVENDMLVTDTDTKNGT